MNKRLRHQAYLEARTSAYVRGGKARRVNGAPSSAKQKAAIRIGFVFVFVTWGVSFFLQHNVLYQDVSHNDCLAYLPQLLFHWFARSHHSCSANLLPPNLR